MVEEILLRRVNAMLCYAMLWYNAPIHPSERKKKKKSEIGKSLASDESPSHLQ